VVGEVGGVEREPLVTSPGPGTRARPSSIGHELHAAGRICCGLVHNRNTSEPAAGVRRRRSAGRGPGRHRCRPDLAVRTPAMRPGQLGRRRSSPPPIGEKPHAGAWISRGFAQNRNHFDRPGAPPTIT